MRCKNLPYWRQQEGGGKEGESGSGVGGGGGGRVMPH